MPSPVSQHAPQVREQAVRIVQEVAEGPAARLVQAEGEQVLRGNVGVDRAQLRIEHDDAGGQRVEQIRRIEVRQRGGRGTQQPSPSPWRNRLRARSPDDCARFGATSEGCRTWKVTLGVVQIACPVRASSTTATTLCVPRYTGLSVNSLPE